jgi:hypothetical protein
MFRFLFNSQRCIFSICDSMKDYITQGIEVNLNVVYMWLFLVGLTIFSGLVSTKIFMILGGMFVVYNAWLVLYTWVHRRRISRESGSKIVIEIGE